MQSRIRVWVNTHRNAINLIKYLLFSVVLIIVAWLIDVRFPFCKAYIPSILLLSPSVTETYLANLSGVFLSISTFTFSTILTVLSLYNSSFAAGTLQMFIDKPIVLNVLGSFFGGFFYSVLSLFMIPQSTYEVDLVSGTFGVVFAFISMVNFIFFVQEVIRDVKANHVVDDLEAEARVLIAEEVEKRSSSNLQAPKLLAYKEKIYAHTTGYLLALDKAKMTKTLSSFQGLLLISQSLGSYVNEGEYIAILQKANPGVPGEGSSEGSSEESSEEGSKEGNASNDPNFQKDQDFPEFQMSPEDQAAIDALKPEIAKGLIIGASPNEWQGYQSRLQYLVEIGIRGLSSGGSDPYLTADCIRKLCSLLGDLFRTDHFYIAENVSPTMQVIIKTKTAKEELYQIFHLLLLRGKSETVVMMALLEGLQITYAKAHPDVKPDVADFFAACYQTACANVTLDLDRQKIESLQEQFTFAHDRLDPMVGEASSEKD